MLMSTEPPAVRLDSSWLRFVFTLLEDSGLGDFAVLVSDGLAAIHYL